MKRINTNFDLADFSKKHIDEIINKAQYNRGYDIGSLNLSEGLDFFENTVIPKVLEHPINPEDEHLFNILIWTIRLGKLSKSLLKNTKRLINKVGPEMAKNLIIKSLISMGTFGAEKIGNYIFGNTPKTKYYHKHVLENGTEIKLLDEILKNPNEDAVTKKINDILRLKYDIGIPIGNVIDQINLGKYDKYVHNKFGY